MPVKDIKAEDLKKLLETEKDNVEIIDVREPEEYSIIHIKGSKLIPMNELVKRMNEINWDKEVVFICRSGARSKMVASLVGSGGKEVKNLQYGIYECYKSGCGNNLEILKDKIEVYF